MYNRENTYQLHLLTDDADDQLLRALVNAGQEGVVHDGVGREELRVCQDALHQNTLRVRVHVHRRVAYV